MYLGKKGGWKPQKALDICQKYEVFFSKIFLRIALFVVFG